MKESGQPKSYRNKVSWKGGYPLPPLRKAACQKVNGKKVSREEGYPHPHHGRKSEFFAKTAVLPKNHCFGPMLNRFLAEKGGSALPHQKAACQKVSRKGGSPPSREFSVDFFEHLPKKWPEKLRRYAPTEGERKEKEEREERRREKKREKDRKGEKRERKRERKDVQGNFYQSAFNLHKEKLSILAEMLKIWKSWRARADQ